MMITQSYYGGSFDALDRSNHRAPASDRYGRSNSYSQQNYYGGMAEDIASSRAGRQSDNESRAVIQEPSPEIVTSGSSRRRIQVACSRCRRRKIKCSGDPGDGSGCVHCRSAGADRNSCVFIRVGSQPLSLPMADLNPMAECAGGSGQSAAPHGSEVTTGPYNSSLYQTHTRPVLPVLQTRTGCPEYSSYNTSPVDDYTYASSVYPRTQSLSSTYNAENFRAYTSGSMSGPSGSLGMYYDPGAALSFGSLHATGPFPSTQASRLSSIYGDPFTPLNMSSLHSSLPTQTVHERRLPIPHSQAQQPSHYAPAGVPQIRPLGSFSEPQDRLPIGGIHSRSSMSWNTDNTTIPPVSCDRMGSTSSIPRPHGLPLPASRGSTSSLVGEPILGYQFSSAAASPAISPSSAPPPLSGSISSSSDSSATSTMLPPSSSSRLTTGPSQMGLTCFADSGVGSSSSDDHSFPRPSSSREAAGVAASLYSFSAGIDNSSSSGRSNSTSTAESFGGAASCSVSGPSNTEDAHFARPQRSYPPPPPPSLLRHPQPQHAVSTDELRRRPSCDQRAASTAHRMSVSNLNARY